MLIEDTLVIIVQFAVVFIDVIQEVICSQDLSDSFKLVVVACALEKGINLEDETGQHASGGPDIEGVIIELVVDEEFRSFVVSGGDSDIEFSVGEEKFSEAPINKSELFGSIIPHGIMGFDVSVDDIVSVDPS